MGWTKRRIQAYFTWAKQVTDSAYKDCNTWPIPMKLVCSPSHPPLGELLSKLYKTAYTRVDGEYFPCHPDECGPFTDVRVPALAGLESADISQEEKERIDKRLNGLKRGEKVCPNPIFF